MEGCLIATLRFQCLRRILYQEHYANYELQITIYWVVLGIKDRVVFSDRAHITWRASRRRLLVVPPSCFSCGVCLLAFLCVRAHTQQLLHTCFGPSEELAHPFVSLDILGTGRAQL